MYTIDIFIRYVVSCKKKRRYVLKLLANQSDRSFAVLTTIWFIFAMSIGERIRQLRKSNHMSQQKLGDRVGRSQQEIYRWEKGLVRVHGDDVGLLAKALGVSVEAFYDETECSGKPVDWELQAASSHMPQQARKKLIDFLSTVYGPHGANPPSPAP